MSRDFDFEQPIIELEKRLQELQAISEGGKLDLSKEIKGIAEKIDRLKEEVYGDLDAWQITKVARHIDRPSTLDFIKYICGEEFFELHGDRLYGDDPAIVAGFGNVNGRSMMIIGQQKGHDTEENIYRNFGMPHPEGYRKTLRMMKLAERFKRPILVFIDTPGAFPGLGAEERGQSEAIARNLAEMSQVRVPIICFVIGEGGSGGALALGVGDRICMFEYSIYSVITAEGCAAILWKDAGKSREATEALKVCAKDHLEAGIIDRVISEPLGGTHRNPKRAAELVLEVVEEFLPDLMKLTPEELTEQRYQKFRAMGQFSCEEVLGNA